MAAVALAVCIYPLVDFDGYLERRQAPTTVDVLAGALLLILLLEACSRTTGWVLPVFSLKSGSIDALVWSGGLPTGGISDLTTSMGKNVKLLPIVDLLPKMQEKYGTIYTQAPIPAATYQQPADVATIIVPNVLLVRKNMKDELAEQLTEVVYDNLDALVAVNAAAKGITLDNAGNTDPVPLHPGAKKAIDGLQ